MSRHFDSKIAVSITEQQLKETSRLRNFFSDHQLVTRSSDGIQFAKGLGLPCSTPHCQKYFIAKGSFVKVVDLQRNDTGDQTTGRRIDFIYSTVPYSKIGELFLTGRLVRCSPAKPRDGIIWNKRGMLGTGIAYANEYGHVMISSIDLLCPAGFVDS
jgi:hypothetical protein